jgi:putative ABC transport system substrate-binding protein
MKRTSLPLQRREFIAGLGSAAAWPVVARAQRSDGIRRVGVLLGPQSDPTMRDRLTALREALGALGWVESRNLHLDYRFMNNSTDTNAYAAELVKLAPDVILTPPSGLKPLQEATRTIPIVFVLANNPVAEGFVTNLNRPGGAVTGFAAYDPMIMGKWLQLLKQIAPHVIRVAFVYDPAVPAMAGFLEELTKLGPPQRVGTTGAAVQNAAEIEAAISAFAREPAGGLLVPSNPVLNANRELICALATRYRLPTVGVYRIFAASGGAMSYGIDDVDQYRLAATYIDRILKGERAGELPIQYPVQYKLVINLKTTKALGLTIPETLLATADEVIQ